MAVPFQAAGGWQGGGGGGGGGGGMGRGGRGGRGGAGGRGGRGGGGRGDKEADEDPHIPHDGRHTITSTQTQQVLARISQHASAEASKENVDISNDAKLRSFKEKHGLRTSFATTNDNKGCRVLANYLQLTGPVSVFVYRVEMIRDKDSQTGNLYTVNKTWDRQLVMEQLVPTVPQLGTNSALWATDGEFIWSTTDLFGNQSQDATVASSNDLRYRNECGMSLLVKWNSIKFHSRIDLASDLGQLFSDPAAASSKRTTASLLLRGLNALLIKHARRAQADFKFTSGSKGYQIGTNHPNHRHQLDVNAANGWLLQAIQGFFLSARPGVENINININTLCSSFWGNAQTVNQVLRSPFLSTMRPQKQEALVKGLRVAITFLPADTGVWQPDETRYRYIHSLGSEITNETCHYDNKGRAVSVRDCFNLRTQQACQRRVAAKQGTGPTVQVGPDGAWSTAVRVARNQKKDPDESECEWYPGEVLTIASNQPFHSPLVGAQTSGMIDIARARPDKNRNRTLTEGLPMFGFDNQQASGLTALGMTVGQQLLSVPARRLDPPTIRYMHRHNTQSKNAEVSLASWTLVDIRFADISKKLQGLPYLNTTAMTKDTPKLKEALKELRDALKRHGILNENNPPDFNERQSNSAAEKRSLATPLPQSAYESTVQSALQNVRSLTSPSSPIMVAIANKNQDMYAYFKRVADLKLGCHTIFVKVSGGDKFGFGMQKASNIALKYNLKLAQTNHYLGDGDFDALRIAGQPCDTIVLGADVTHPGRGCAPGTPSIAAVVGTTDDQFMHFPGSMRLQRSKKEYIIELGDMVKERLIDWAVKHNGRLPRKVLFYRDGVSESQYAKLRTFEMPQIAKAFNWAREYLDWRKTNSSPTAVLEGDRNPWPKVSNPSTKAKPRERGVEDEFEDKTGLEEPFELTYIVVGKRHHTRFYPMDDAGTIHKSGKPKGNVLPGLLVDQVITDPCSFDFYLQSHDPIIGTGRSAHYFVLCNNMHLTTAEVQDITHKFCYAYSRATKGVSYCAPAYYADRLCDRGRCYIRQFYLNVASHQPPANPDKRPQPEYHDFVKDWMRSQEYYRPSCSPQRDQNNQLLPQPMKYGFVRRNPWHENLDDVMFYL